MEHTPPGLMETAYGQGGVVSTQQISEAGFTRTTLRRLVESGTWRKVGKGFYEIVYLPDVQSRLRAAATLLPTAVISHESAAQIHGFDGVDRDLITLTVNSSATHHMEWAEVHRNSDLLPHHRQEIDSMTVTTPVRTVFDLANSLGEYAFTLLVDQQRMLKVFSLADLESLSLELCRRGKPGSAFLRSYNQNAALNSATSPLERRAKELFERAELDQPEAEFPIPWAKAQRFDFAFITQRLAIELDGYRYHMTKQKFQSDRDRDRLARRNGWNLLRLTWHDIVNRPQQVIADIEYLLANPLPLAHQPT